MVCTATTCNGKETFTFAGGGGGGGGGLGRLRRLEINVCRPAPPIFFRKNGGCGY